MNTCPNVAPPPEEAVTVIAAEALDELLLDQLTARPVRMLPAASFSVAVAWSVPPTTTLDDARLTVTDATGTSVTVMVAEPLLPSLVAVIVAVPAATPVTRPLVLTEAVEELLLDQLTARPVRMLPAASFSVAVAWSVPPITTLGDARLTVTDDTGAGAGASTTTWPVMRVPCTAQS